MSITKVKGGYKLTAKSTGRSLGTFKTKKAAEKRDRQVRGFAARGR